MEACPWMGFKSALAWGGRERWLGAQKPFQIHCPSYGGSRRVGLRIGAHGRVTVALLTAKCTQFLMGSEEQPPSAHQTGPRSCRIPSTCDHCFVGMGGGQGWSAQRGKALKLFCADQMGPKQAHQGIYREEGDGRMLPRVTRDRTLALAQPWLTLKMEKGTMNQGMQCRTTDPLPQAAREMQPAGGPLRLPAPRVRR